MTRTITWNFDNPSDYVKSNTVISGGFGTLSQTNETVLENTRAGYATGSKLDNVSIDLIPNSIVLDENSQTVTRVVIQPGPTDGKDSYLLQNWPSQNYGDQTSMMIESLDAKNDRPLMRFDLSAIPSNAIVQDAMLCIDFLKSNKPNPVVFNVYALTMDWMEMETTWTLASIGIPWTDPGGTYNPASFFRATTTGTQGWTIMDVSRLVELWVRGTLANFGLIMVPDNGDNTASWKYFYSSDEATADLRPKLIVNYTIPGLVGTYESRALGPGTNSTFTLASWTDSSYSSLTDEFTGTSLSSKWSWLNRPSGGSSYDVGVTRPGWLHVVGDLNAPLSNTTIGANYLYQNETGPFTSSTPVNATFTLNGQGAGILVEDNPLDWISLTMTGAGASAKISMQTTQNGITTELSYINWAGSPVAYLRLNGTGASYSGYYSSDGATWTLLGTYTPSLPLRDCLRVGLCVYSSGGATRPVVDFDYFRATPILDPTTLTVQARLGNSTTLTDPSWEPWGAQLPSKTGSMLGRVAEYVQYRIAMTTTQEWYLPQFNGFECRFERYASDGTIVTIDQSISHLKQWLTITTTEQLVDGKISYSYSVDHGATWKPLLLGSNSVTDTEPYMMVSVSIHTNDTISSPKVDQIVAQYGVSASSFYMVTPASVIAGEHFGFTLEARDEMNATISHWTGNVNLEAMDSAGAGPASSTLEVTSAWISVGGSVVVGSEAYPVAEVIRIEASADGISSLSEPIVVMIGAINSIIIQPNTTSMLAYSNQTFTASAFDALGNPVLDADFTWSADAALGQINATTGDSVLLSVGAPLTSGWLNVTADGIMASLFIEVSPVLYPPVILPLPAQVMPEDYGEWTLNLTDYVSDEDNTHDQLRWYTTREFIITVRGENRTGNMIMTFRTKLDQFGINVLDLFVVDPDGLTARTTLYVEITPVNDAPTIQTISPLLVHYDQPYVFNFEYYVHDVDNATSDLHLSVDATSEPYTIIDRLTIAFTYPKALVDTTQTVAVTVSDGLLSSSTVVIIQVTSDGIPFIIGGLHDLVLYQGQRADYEYDLSTCFRDPDKGDVLYYVSGNSHVLVDILDNGSVNVTAPTDWYGEEYVVFMAMDSAGARAEIAVSITILKVDKPPVIRDIPDLYVRYDERYEFDLTPYVSDPDDSINDLSLSVDDFHGYFIGPVLSLLYPLSMNGRRVTMNITATDAAQSVTRTINITISSDYPPTVDPDIPDHVFQEDHEVRYPITVGLDAYFSDRDNDSLSYYAFSVDPNVNATAVYDDIESRWVVSFDAVENYNGLSSFTIRAMDTNGSFIEHTCALEIVPVPDPPVLNMTHSVRVIEGSQYVLSFANNISDPDSSLAEGDFSFQVRLASTDTEGKEIYLTYIKVLPAILVFEFPNGFVERGNEKTFKIEIRVTDQDGKIGTSELTVTVVKVKGQSNPWTLIAMLLSAAFAGGLFLAVMRTRKKPFVIRDMMLIHNDGFLIGRYAGHSHIEGEIDQDILSGMLTAVLNFVEDSMVSSQDQLKTFGFKEFQVLVKRGARTFAAIVYEGDLPDNLDKPLSEFVKTFERVYKKKVSSWTGDIETDFAGVELLIQGFVHEHSKKHGGKAKRLWVSKTGNGGPTAK